MATEGQTFDQWLESAGVCSGSLNAHQTAVLRAAFELLQHGSRDYSSVRIAGHSLLHCNLGLKISQIARLIGVARPTASRYSQLSAKEVVQEIHHRMVGRPYGKLLARYAGPIAEFLVTHPGSSRYDVLDFIQRTWNVRVSTVALYHFLKKYGLDSAQREQARARDDMNETVMSERALIEALKEPPTAGMPIPVPPEKFFCPHPIRRSFSAAACHNVLAPNRAAVLP